MKKVAVLSGLFLGLFLVSTAAAVPFTADVANDVYALAQGGAANGTPTANDSNDGAPDQFNAVNRVIATAYTHNYQLDARFVEPDYVWQSLLNPSPIVLIGLTASNSNTLGFYTDMGTGSASTPLIGPVSGFGYTGDGSISDPFTGVLSSSLPASNVPFGWYLNSSGTNYFSESALNAGGWDHMMSFALPELAGIKYYIDDGNGGTKIPVIFTKDAYLLAWEDLPYSVGKLGDEDYDDMMYLVAKVEPVPIPAAAWLLGSGLIGLVAVRRRMKK